MTEPRNAGTWKPRVSGSGQHRKQRIPLILLAIVVLFAYAPVLRSSFIGMDDPLQVTANPHVSSGLSVKNLYWAFTHGHLGYWIPLTWLSHMLDVTLFQLNAAGHHATNLILHLVNTLLVYSSFCALFGVKQGMDITKKSTIPIHWRCLAVSVFFGLHPLHVESVAWIAERKDVLSMFFGLLCLRTYVWYVAAPRYRRLVLPLAFLLLGLLSKPMLVTLPCILLLLDFWPLCRTPASVCQGSVSSPRCSWRMLLQEKFPFFLLSLMVAVITSLLHNSFGAMAPWARWGIWQRVSTALAGYAGYLQHVFFPSGLVVHYPVLKHVPFFSWGSGLLLLTGISLIVFKMRKKAPYLPVGWLWFVVALIPVIGLTQAGTQSMADRFVYFPCLGLYLAVVWSMADVFEKIREGHKIGLAILLALSLVLAMLTYRQAGSWRNSSTLYERCVRILPKNAYMQRLIGNLYFDGREFGLAEAHYVAALALDPHHATTWKWLGMIQFGQKRYEEALESFSRSLGGHPNDFDVQKALKVCRQLLQKKEKTSGAPP